VRCVALQADLATSDAVKRIVTELERLDLKIDLLINNAGLGLTGDFLSHDLAEELASIQVNVQALVGLSHALGTKMVSRGTGGIINLASNSAFQPPNFFEGVSTKMKDGAFDSAELVVRRTLRSFDQKKSVAYPGRSAPQRRG
jgi:hypothetical protein